MLKPLCFLYVFVFVFLNQHMKGFPSNRHSIKSRAVIGPENILFGSMCVCAFFRRNFASWGNEGVNKASCCNGHFSRALSD